MYYILEGQRKCGGWCYLVIVDEELDIAYAIDIFGILTETYHSSIRSILHSSKRNWSFWVAQERKTVWERSLKHEVDDTWSLGLDCNSLLRTSYEVQAVWTTKNSTKYQCSFALIIEVLSISPWWVEELHDNTWSLGSLESLPRRADPRDSVRFCFTFNNSGPKRLVRMRWVHGAALLFVCRPIISFVEQYDDGLVNCRSKVVDLSIMDSRRFRWTLHCRCLWNELDCSVVNVSRWAALAISRIQGYDVWRLARRWELINMVRLWRNIWRLPKKTQSNNPRSLVGCNLIEVDSTK